MLNYLGYGLVDRGEKLDEALGMIEKAVAAEPDRATSSTASPGRCFSLAAMTRRWNRWSAPRFWNRSIPIVTDHLGDVYWAVGRKLEAQFQWRRALSFEPTEKDAERIRRKLEVGLDAVLAEEARRPPKTPVEAAGNRRLTSRLIRCRSRARQDQPLPACHRAAGGRLPSARQSRGLRRGRRQGHRSARSGPVAAHRRAGSRGLVGRRRQSGAARCPAMGVTDAALTLWKALPVASGIGGGSADAAATLRALARMTGQGPARPRRTVLRLGADVPVCLAGRPAADDAAWAKMLRPLPPLPPLWLVLVNPRVAGADAAGLCRPASTAESAGAGPAADGPASAAGLAAWLGAATRNDLVTPRLAGRARSSLEVQAALDATPDCLLARMSGSGGTHFGLFASEAAASAAAAQTCARPSPAGGLPPQPVLAQHGHRRSERAGSRFASYTSPMQFNPTIVS